MAAVSPERAPAQPSLVEARESGAALTASWEPAPEQGRTAAETDPREAPPPPPTNTGLANAPGGSEFHIIELLEHMPYDHSFVNAVRQGGQELPPGAQSVLMRARKWTLYKPYLASVDFDSYNHAGTEKLSTVTVEVVYDKYDYDYVYHRFYGDPVLPAVLAGQPRRGLGSGDSMSTSMGAQGSPLPGAGRGGIAGEAGDLPLPPGIPTPE